MKEGDHPGRRAGLAGRERWKSAGTADEQRGSSRGGAWPLGNAAFVVICIFHCHRYRSFDRAEPGGLVRSGPLLVATSISALARGLLLPSLTSCGFTGGAAVRSLL